MSKLYQQLTGNQLPQNNQKLSIQKNDDLKTALLNSKNPMEFLSNLAQQNPKMQQAMNLFQASNMTPKQFFLNYAQQMGVDPNQIVNSLR